MVRRSIVLAERWFGCPGSFVGEVLVSTWIVKTLRFVRTMAARVRRNRSLGKLDRQCSHEIGTGPDLESPGRKRASNISLTHKRTLGDRKRGICNVTGPHSSHKGLPASFCKRSFGKHTRQREVSKHGRRGVGGHGEGERLCRGERAAIGDLVVALSDRVLIDRDGDAVAAACGGDLDKILGVEVTTGARRYRPHRCSATAPAGDRQVVRAEPARRDAGVVHPHPHQARNREILRRVQSGLTVKIPDTNTPTASTSSVLPPEPRRRR